MRRDPLTGRVVVVAPARAARPGAWQVDGIGESRDADPSCPFCEGSESETPPETLALAAPGRQANAPGWRLRVVPNRFPALTGDLGRQEVVIHSPRHLTSLADLSDGTLGEIAQAWQDRARAAGGSGFEYLHALVNEGRAAGSSLPHGHSQLVWLPHPPPAVERELVLASGRCALCDLIAAARAGGELVVLDRDGLVALSPPSARSPYELLIAPAACEADGFASALLAPALRSCAALVRHLHQIEGRAPLNLWLHTAPLAGGRLHWHIELVPRLTVLAGLELGAEIYVNPVAPEDAAARLRAAKS